MSETNQFFETCFLCGQKFEFGSHKYYGKFLPHYKIVLCNSCYQGNWNGFVGHNKAKIIAHLKENNIPVPDLDEEERLPRGM